MASNTTRNPLVIILFVLATALVDPAPLARAEGPTTQAVTYPLEDFEVVSTGFFTFPFMYGDFGSAKGSSGLETKIVHGGKQSARWEWDTTSPTPMKNSRIDVTYVFYFKGSRCRLLGEPSAVSIWVYAEPAMVATPVRIFIDDASGEVFSGQIKVPQAGWSQLVFELKDLKAIGSSGNGNKVINYPVTLGGFYAGAQGSKGALVVDDLEVTTKGAPRSLVDSKARLEADGVGWGHSPTLAVDVINYSDEVIKDMTLNAVVDDTLSTGTEWKSSVDVPQIAGRKTQRIILPPLKNNGVYDLKWTLSDAAGVLPGSSGGISLAHVARMAGDVDAQIAGAAARKYATDWGQIGGVFWSTPLSLAKKTGAVWERIGHNSLWRYLETEPGRIDTTLFSKCVRQDADAGIGIVYMAPLYYSPAFYALGQERYAGKYGDLFAHLAQASGNRVPFWELGNEDNGAAKFLWSEVARNGAAGVRSKSSAALIGSTGSAAVDVNFMQLQANRGVLDRLDAIVTHPYTWTSSPESYGVLGQLEEIDQLIDDLGGMKIQLTTEFGYSESFEPLKRAQWISRNYAIGAAADLYRHGLYAFNQEFGIFNGTDPCPAAAALDAYALMTSGHRFVGWFEKSDSVWAAVYEKAGTPMLMAWSPAGTGQLRLPMRADGKPPELRDLFGNLLPAPAPSGDGKSITVATGESPIYFSDVSGEVTAIAYRHELERARSRYRRCLANSDLKTATPWKSLGDGELPPAKDLREAIEGLKPDAPPMSKGEQAVIAQTLRWLIVATHADAAAGKIEQAETTADLRPEWVARLKRSVDEDVDQPALRWLLHNWTHAHDEAAMVRELGNHQYASCLAGLEPFYAHLAGVLAHRAPGLFFPVWPYLHAPSTDGQLTERLTFVPGKGVPVKVRLRSYSTHAYAAEVTLDLPSGWKAAPTSWKGQIEPGTSQDVMFSVTAGNDTGGRVITAVLAVPDKPPVRVAFDDFSVLPPLEVRAPVLSKLLPGVTLPLQLINNGATALGASVRLINGIDTPALARAEVASIVGGETKNLELAIPTTLKAPAFNEWNLFAEVKTSDGKKFNVPLPIDFDLAVRATTPLTIDGDLRDWKEAAPLHLDQEAYTHGSYPSGWSKEDESGTAYTQWDEKNFYVAVHVLDQTFQQALTGGDVWMQDSVQFCLVGPDKQRHQFSLALTPQGPQIWSNVKGGLVTDGQLKVVVKPGEATYEASIPWSAFPGLKPAIGQTFRFDVLLNDDDAIVKRRAVERYGTTIVAALPESDRLGYLHLGDAPPPTATNDAAQPKIVFHEDFEEYAADALPDTWLLVGGPNAAMQSVVRAAVGAGGSKCLEVLRLDKANGYLNLIRPLTGLRDGKKYRLTFKVKGTFTFPAPFGSAQVCGTCLDHSGNIGYNWPAAWPSSDQWQDVSMDWTAVGGDLNLILRNSTATTKSVLIDEIKVVQLP